MSDKTTTPTGDAQSSSPKTMPTAPSKMQVWFPAGVWLRKYDWGKNTIGRPDRRDQCRRLVDSRIDGVRRRSPASRRRSGCTLRRLR